MNDLLTAHTVHFAGAGGDDIEGYFAYPAEPARRGSVVLIHHMPGYDRATKEMVRRFAEMGYNTVCPNLYYREAPDLEPGAAADLVRSQGGVPDDRLVGDVAGAREFLLAQDGSNGKTGVIGYCSGGRQSVLAACSLPLDAAVDCYGAFVTGTPPAGMPFRKNIVDKLPDLQCPLLGLFGNDDQHPSPAEVDELQTILTEHGKTFEFHRYDGTGHSFFASDRDAYRPKSAGDGWQRIRDWYGRYLS